MHELEVARQAAETAGAIAARYFREKNANVWAKATSNLVTQADVEAERAIVEIIRTAFPHHEILGEEGQVGNVLASDAWVVDPIDGTNNFAHGLPHFAVSIAYCKDGRPECGIVHNPITNDWFVARRGHGATHNDGPVRVADHKHLDESLIALGFYCDRGTLMEATLAVIRDLFARDIHGIRRFGAAALDLCMVGCGSYGAFFEYRLAPWDFAAGWLFVEETGGRVSDCQGRTLTLTRAGILASNGLLHEAVLDIVRRHEPPTPAE